MFPDWQRLTQGDVNFGANVMQAATQTRVNGTGRDGLVVLLPVLLALALGGYVQAQTYLNHDVAWVLHSSERLLEGGTFGRDIIASNPPLIWWLNAPIAGLAKMIGADPINVFRAVVLTMIAGVLALLKRELDPMMSAPMRAGILVCLALMLTVGVHRDFGQREHLAVILCLPWLMLVVGQNVRPLPALLAGVAAGIAICFKPHFLAVPALIWAYVALRERSFRPVLRVDTAALLLTGVVYVAATWMFARPYLTEVMPMISQVYWGFEHAMSDVVLSDPAPTLLTLVALGLAWRGGWQALPSLTALAAAGFLIAAIVQSKGYSYHFYPPLAFAMLSLLLTALAPVARIMRAMASIALTAGVALTTLYASLHMTNLSATGPYGQRTACLVNMVQTHVPEGAGFMAFSTHPYPGFPVANYADRTWVAATNSRLFLPSIVRLRARADLSQDAARVLALAEAAERDLAFKDLQKRPHLVFVDARERRHAIDRLKMDFIAFYTEDADFARAWEGYAEIPSCAPGIRAFTLSQEG
ncbi:MAG: hypothetical protein AAGK79_07840 [Pseudomonadota bacterium]